MAPGFCLKGDDVGAEGGPEVDTGRSLKREFRALSVMICGSVSDVETCRGEVEKMHLPRLSTPIVDAGIVCQVWSYLMKLGPQLFSWSQLEPWHRSRM